MYLNNLHLFIGETMKSISITSLALLATASLLSTTTLAAPSSSKSMSSYKSNDMVHVFGWMEDACTGEKPSYKKIAAKDTAFINSIRGQKASGDFVKPKSQWLSEYRNMIKDVKMKKGEPYTEYRVIFNKGVTYRGQPLEEYTFSFIPESSGGENVLKFASTATVPTIMPNFQTRTMEYWGEMEKRGAEYDSKNKTVTCYFW